MVVSTTTGVGAMWLLPAVHHWTTAKRTGPTDDLHFILVFGFAGYGIILLAFLAFLALIRFFCF